LNLTKAKPIPKELEVPIVHLVLEQGKRYYVHRTATNEDEVNVAVDYLTLVGPYESRRNSHLDLFVQCFNTAAYHQLRTQEQLGYIVYACKKFSNDIAFLRVLIQSEAYSPDHVEERIKLWLASVETQVEEMTDEDFDESKEALIQSKLEKFKSLAEQFSSWADEIRTHRFDRWAVEAKLLKEMTKKDLIEFYRTYLKESINSTTFIFKLYSNKFPQQATENDNVISITNVQEFQSAAQKHAVFYSPSNEPRKDLRF